MTAEQWRNGSFIEPRRVSLKPESMKAGKITIIIVILIP